MALDPFSALGTGVNLSIKILELTFQLTAVGEQTAELIRTAAHVDRNVHEARRLYHLKEPSLNNNVRSWMHDQISDCESALRELQQLLEPARVKTETKDSIGGKNRMLWVFRDNARVRGRLDRLNACHQTLNNIIGILHAKDVVVVTPVPVERPSAETPPPYNEDWDAMFRWRSIGRNRKSSTNLGSSNLPSPSTSLHDLNTCKSEPSIAIPPINSRPSSASSVQTGRPPLISSMSDSMTARAVPSSFYSSYDGEDGLQVAGSSSFDHLPVDEWTPVMVQPSVDPISNQTNQLSSSIPPVPPKVPVETHQNREKAFIPTLGDSAPSTESGQERASLPFATTMGRQWLAYYAAKSDLQVTRQDSYGDG